MMYVEDHVAARLSLIGDPVFLKSDPCLACTIYPDCNQQSKKCGYVQITGRRAEVDEDRFSDEEIKAGMIAILEVLIKQKHGS